MLATATRHDVYQNFPSTAPTRYETLASAQSLASLERTLHTLLSPFDYQTAGAWLDAALTAMSDTVGTEIRMPKVGAGETAWDAIERTIDTFAAKFHGNGDASIPEHLHRSAMIRVLVPPFKAGVAEWRRLAVRRSELTALLDAIPEAVLMFDAAGGLVHANPRAAELFGMPGSTGTGSHVRTEAQRMAWALAAAAQRGAANPVNAQTTREVRADGRVYRLRGTLAKGWMPANQPGVLVTAAFEMVNPLTDLELRSRFGLSAREIEVARLVATGLSNQEVALKLGVSYFTARNHVERLLSKLGVANRSRVGAVLRNEAAA
ncbi:MAG TPA: LuxR C-terminal-related transcriptional regulator [Gemmatimonadaceae bacterium]|nr:LuxR C-terminal-related transcriptional regulator [Gemmatimonadaceae bacterium]